ncbi:hypothetical protein [Halomonas sp. M4R1S46]|uniref:hypothetical protein n=1 Tax=Halomonas sp. M4R1S46 TaxID=2982692 RepID=UPI0021E4403F|nr:hypothetical protein [Halomonas sp. M4R1S46]UYG09273.1 hypothetical protein OCT48_08080 [Halomonas sp. M4R1S46]
MPVLRAATARGHDRRRYQRRRRGHPSLAPLERTIDAWRSAGAEVGYRRAPGLWHGALHAHAPLPAMRAAWRDFCAALAHRLA